jgi:hypothetical protein
VDFACPELSHIVASFEVNHISNREGSVNLFFSACSSSLSEHGQGFVAELSTYVPFLTRFSEL